MNIKFTSHNYPGIQFTCVRRNRSYKKARYEFTKNRLVVTDYGNANLDPRKIYMVFTDAPNPSYTEIGLDSWGVIYFWPLKTINSHMNFF